MSAPAGSSPTSESITALLIKLREGKREAVSLLAPRVYDELRRAAARHMRRERANHTLQPTALVNEAWVRLMDLPNRGGEHGWESRTHFFAVASILMRQILVDHARKRLAAKRGGTQHQVTLAEPLLATYPAPVDVLALDQALERFQAIDARATRVLELHFFGGLSFDEIAGVLDVSTRTVKRDWTMARAWLHDELSKTR